jgi:MFS family permease
MRLLPSSGVATRWLLLAILTGSYGAGAFGMLGISPLSPSLVAGCGLTRLQVALLVPSIYLGGLLFALPAGRLADRVGVRRSLLGGLIVGAVGLAVGAAAPAFPAFLFCLFVAGSGWSVINPALGKAIMDLFPAPERGMAMGIKQMGLTLGGIASAMVLPRVAAVVAVAVAFIWRPLGVLDRGAPAGPMFAAAPSDWSWAWRVPILAFFACGLILGMVQAAVLSYLPLYTVQALGFDTIGADTSSRAPRRAARCPAWPSGRRAIAGSPTGDRCGWCSPAASAPRRLPATPSAPSQRRSARQCWRSRPGSAPTAGWACSS